jgi:hypothetical protein
MDGERFTIKVDVTVGQLWEIDRRAGLGRLTGRARSEYLVGCALGEPRRALLARVREVRAAELEAFRIEIENERRQREQRHVERERARGEREQPRAVVEGSHTPDCLAG